jgi:hypothetical protein
VFSCAPMIERLKAVMNSSAQPVQKDPLIASPSHMFMF